MTFLEAAIAILQREGRPLHYRKLTEIALKENLLTVVGRTPEATMQQRLNDALKKEDGTGVLLRDKPGVFGLRHYPSPGTEAPRPSVAEAAPAATPAAAPAPARVRAEAEAAPRAEDRKRRRRGGRGRRRRGEGVTTQPDLLPAGSLHPTADDGDDDFEGEAAQAQPMLPPLDGEGDEPPPLPPPPTALVPAVATEAPRPAPGSAASSAGAGPATARPGLPGQPEVRSFAEAAVFVATAHRRRAGLPEPVPTAPPAAAAAPAASGEPAAVAGPPRADTAIPALATAAPADRSEPADGGDGAEEIADQLEDFDRPSGPLIAPAFGTEELVRGEEHREPIAPGERRRGRERHRDRRNRQIQEKRAEAEARRAAATSPAAAPAPAAHAPPAPRPAEARPSEPRAGVELSPIEAAIEILRGSDGRPVHVRQIVEMALKRRLLRGELNDLIRLVRGAIVVDTREREAGGLRPRVRAAGGSSYQLADRRLEQELAQAERELGERAGRLGEATRQALLRRLGKLPGHAFEALMRLLVARLGIADIELVKRGEGVAYFGGEREAPAGEGRRRKVLIGLRPGEAELTRRAVGELRAGLRARGFDEGLLLSAGRIGAEALSELGTAGGAVAVHDADELASLCLRHGVGVMRRAVPVDVLDVDLLSDLAEA